MGDGVQNCLAFGLLQRRQPLHRLGLRLCLLQIPWQVPGFQPVTAAFQEHAFEHIAQLTNIARPVVRSERRQKRRINLGRGGFIPFTDLLEKMRRKNRQIPDPRPQGGSSSDVTAIR